MKSPKLDKVAHGLRKSPYLKMTISFFLGLVVAVAFTGQRTTPHQETKRKEIDSNPMLEIPSSGADTTQLAAGYFDKGKI